MVEKEAQGPHGKIPLPPTLSPSEGEREKPVQAEHTHMNVGVNGNRTTVHGCGESYSVPCAVAVHDPTAFAKDAQEP